MFRVQLELPVRHRSGRVMLERLIELPFPPSPGLVLQETKDSDTMLTVGMVFWCLREQTFYAVCDERTEPAGLLEVLQRYDLEGWTLQGDGTDEKVCTAARTAVARPE